MSQLLLSRPIVAFVLFVERWFLSAAVLFLAYEYADTLRLLTLLRASQDLMPHEITSRDAGLLDGVHFEDFARYGLLTGMSLVSGALLLCSRRPVRRPSRAQEVVVPLAATFSYLIFNQRLQLPAWMTTPLAPDAWLTPAAVAGVGVSAVGAAFSLLAILWLGRSLGIVISVRRVVLSGPYGFVRHPIYLGYVGILIGLLLTACTFRMLVMAFGALALLVWRARLEEQMLCAHSPAYRELMSRTGFLLPKFWLLGAKTAPAPAPDSLAPLQEA